MEEKKKPTPRTVNLKDNILEKLIPPPQYPILRAALRVSLRVTALLVCLALCCCLFWLEAVTVEDAIPIVQFEELRAVENEEGHVHLKNFTLLLWVFAVYTLISEMMQILAINEKIRILEAFRHRSKMESIISLIRQKSYFDADAVEFILQNNSNTLITTVNDEMEAEVMVHHRVHGMDPHRKFNNSKE